MRGAWWCGLEPCRITESQCCLREGGCTFNGGIPVAILAHGSSKHNHPSDSTSSGPTVPEFLQSGDHGVQVSSPEASPSRTDGTDEQVIVESSQSAVAICGDLQPDGGSVAVRILQNRRGRRSKGKWVDRPHQGVSGLHCNPKELRPLPRL